MKYIITESKLIRIVERIIVESEIPDYVKPYLDSECVTYKKVGDYIIINVESPTYFVSNGFGKSEGLWVKDKLRKDNFISIGVGEYAKKIV